MVEPILLKPKPCQFALFSRLHIKSLKLVWLEVNFLMISLSLELESFRDLSLSQDTLSASHPDDVLAKALNFSFSTLRLETSFSNLLVFAS